MLDEEPFKPKPRCKRRVYYGVDTDAKICTYCNGSGVAPEVRLTNDGFLDIVDGYCKNCDGEGKIDYGEV